MKKPEPHAPGQVVSELVSVVKCSLAGIVRRRDFLEELEQVVVVANKMAKCVSMLAKELLLTKLEVGESLPALNQSFFSAMYTPLRNGRSTTRVWAASWRRSWRSWERDCPSRSTRITVVTMSASMCGGRECVWIQLMVKKIVTLTRKRHSSMSWSVTRGSCAMTSRPKRHAAFPYSLSPKSKCRTWHSIRYASQSFTAASTQNPLQFWESAPELVTHRTRCCKICSWLSISRGLCP